MNKDRKVYFFIGTTAELIKLFPVIAELKRRKEEFKIISSNQNELRFKELESIFGRHKADYIFKMKPFAWPKNIYLRFIIWIVKSLGNYLIYFRNEFKSDREKVLFIVHGDTVTALVGAVIAKLCRVKLVHVESGLRSFSFLEPFPEEFNRFIISWLADVHFSPNRWAVKNLRNHLGIKINTYYNTVGESIRLALQDKKEKRLEGLSGIKYFILVLHRQEHTLFNRRKTEELIDLIIKSTRADFKCVFVMHKLTKDFLRRGHLLDSLKKNKNIVMPPRLPYVEFIKLMKNAEFIATDGGSNQEETYYLGLPCLILRNYTERIEGLGENVVLSKNDPKIINEFISNYKSYKRKPPVLKKSPSKLIVNYLFGI